jgi:hypothetical protein
MAWPSVWRCEFQQVEKENIIRKEANVPASVALASQTE